MVFHRWTVWRFTHPDIEILAFPSLEEHDIVAIIEFRQLVELVKLRLGIKFSIFPAVRKESVEIVQEVSVPVCDATRG